LATRTTSVDDRRLDGVGHRAHVALDRLQRHALDRRTVRAVEDVIQVSLVHVVVLGVVDLLRQAGVEPCQRDSSAGEPVASRPGAATSTDRHRLRVDVRRQGGVLVGQLWEIKAGHGGSPAGRSGVGSEGERRVLGGSGGVAVGWLPGVRRGQAGRRDCAWPAGAGWAVNLGSLRLWKRWFSDAEICDPQSPRSSEGAARRVARGARRTARRGRLRPPSRTMHVQDVPSRSKSFTMRTSGRERGGHDGEMERGRLEVEPARGARDTARQQVQRPLCRRESKSSTSSPPPPLPRP
jgi:hypothetical protein